MNPHPGGFPSVSKPKDSDPPFADVLESSLNLLPLLRARSLKGGAGGTPKGGEESASKWGESGEGGGETSMIFLCKKRSPSQNGL